MRGDIRKVCPECDGIYGCEACEGTGYIWIEIDPEDHAESVAFEREEEWLARMDRLY